MFPERKWVLKKRVEPKAVGVQRRRGKLLTTRRKVLFRAFSHLQMFVVVEGERGE